MNTYLRLQASEREEISRGLACGWTYSHIANNIHRSISTVSREVNNNCTYKRCYRAERAQARATVTRHGSKQIKKLDGNQLLRDYVFTKLRLQWSPEEIAKRLPTDYPEDMTMRLSHETIYTYIYCLPRGELRKELIRCLRHERKLRHSRKHPHAKRGTITNAISISERPPETAERTIPGHWEGDLIMGNKRSNSALGTLVERTTRYTLLIPLTAHDAYTVRTALAQAVKKIPRDLKKSLTYDRGTEMAQHELFTKDTKIQVYFADPHSPWQRGTNENTNGLIRQYFSKGIDFRTVSKQQIQLVQDRLNDRPRKALGFLKPNEVFLPLLTN
jgi:IS30 family transposase